MRRTSQPNPRPRNGVFFTTTPNRRTLSVARAPRPTPTEKTFFAPAANCGTWVRFQRQRQRQLNGGANLFLMPPESKRFSRRSNVVWALRATTLVCADIPERWWETNSRLRLPQAFDSAVAALVKARADLQNAHGKACPRSYETRLQTPGAPFHSQWGIGIRRSSAPPPCWSRGW